MKALRAFSVLVLVTGTCLTGRALYLRAKADLAGILIRRAWELGLKSGKAPAPWPWADTYPVARLEIPRLGYDEIVLEGATPRTLAFGPAHMQNGAGLGEPGNLILAGHRTSWFRPLEAITQGDTITMQWFDTRHRELRERTYTVSMIRVTKPQKMTLLEPTAEDELTLITCYPFGSSPRSPQRYIVRASPLGPGHPAEDTAVSQADPGGKGGSSAMLSRGSIVFQTAHDLRLFIRLQIQLHRCVAASPAGTRRLGLEDR